MELCELKKWCQIIEVQPAGQRNLAGVIDVEEVEIIPSEAKRLKEEPPELVTEDEDVRKRLALGDGRYRDGTT
eukprot:symbB.v1.2.041537.t1/scaffold8325.1/size6815/1